MKKFVLAAALVLAWSAQPGWAARKACGTPAAAVEAEQAIRYITDLMVASSTCRDTIYAEFALRNRTAIIRYQKAMIVHLHSTRAFDAWDTRIANEASQRQAVVPPTQFCQQAAPLLQQASALDIKGFQAFAAARAASAGPAGARCER
jgi:hypothetical protein